MPAEVPTLFNNCNFCGNQHSMTGTCTCEKECGMLHCPMKEDPDHDPWFRQPVPIFDIKPKEEVND